MDAGRRWAIAAGLLAPWAVGLGLVPFRDAVARTNAALVLVVVVVGVAALGQRAAGPVAALSAGACFDFLLTRPYQSFSIAARDDVETAALLVVVGVLVGELATWGHRQQARYSRSRGYLDGIREALESVAADVPAQVLVERVRAQLISILGLAGCRFEPGLASGHQQVSPDAPHEDPAVPMLRPDGEVEIDGAVCDIRHFGLPLSHDIELPVGRGTRQVGRFWLTARPDSRPALEARLVAVSLADRAAASIAAAVPRTG